MALPHPPLPELDDPTLIFWVDVVRQLEVILGLGVAALLVRSLLRIPDNLRPLLQLKGYRTRVVALVVGLVLLALQSYQRLGEPVVVGIFPVGLIFLILTAYALHLGITYPPPPSEVEERLAEFEPPKWQCPSVDDERDD